MTPSNHHSAEALLTKPRLPSQPLIVPIVMHDQRRFSDLVIEYVDSHDLSRTQAQLVKSFVKEARKKEE